jgi:hypothetical protein
MRHTFSLAVAAALPVFPLGSAVAQVGESNYAPSQAATLASRVAANATAGDRVSPAKVIAELNVYEGMSHAQFQDFRITPEGREVYTDLARFCDRYLGK